MRRVSRLAGVLAVLAGAGGAASQEERPLRAGAARVDMTPPENAGIRMSGYGDRKDPFKGIHDRLHIRAIALDDGRQTAAVVTADLVGISDSLWREVTGRVAREAGIPVENILLCGTHTHGGPSGDYLGSKPVVDKFVEAVKLAKDALQPARFGTGRGRCNINVNRRARTATGTAAGGWWLGQNPDGPSDKTVYVAKFEALSGEPIAILVNFAAHGTTMGQKNTLITADHPGACSRFIEKHYGDKVVAPWTSGAAGDQDPIYAYKEEFGGRVDPVNVLGRMLGEEAVRVAEGIRGVPHGRLRALQTVVEAPGRRNESGVSPFRPDGDYRFVDASPVKIRLSLLAVEGTAFCGISGEVFTRIGERLRKESPFPDTVLLTHANGSSGYLPDDGAYGQISYEILVTRVKPGVEKIVVDGLVGLMKTK